MKYSKYSTHQDEQDGFSHDDNHQSNLNSVGHSHHGAHLRTQSTKVLFWCLIVTLSFSIIEGVGGYYTNSIALQSDAVHMLTDAAGLLIAYIANIISKRPATVNLTFGYGNAEAVGALINCIFTVILTIGLLIEVVHRLFNEHVVLGGGMLLIACIGFVANGGLVLILSKYTDSLNIKATLIHALGDLFGALVAIIAGIIIYFTGWFLADPLLSLVVIILLLYSTYTLMKKSLLV